MVEHILIVIVHCLSKCRQIHKWISFRKGFLHMWMYLRCLQKLKWARLHPTHPPNEQPILINVAINTLNKIRNNIWQKKKKITNTQKLNKLLAKEKYFNNVYKFYIYELVEKHTFYIVFLKFIHHTKRILQLKITGNRIPEEYFFLTSLSS